MGLKLLRNGKIFTCAEDGLKEALVLDGERVAFVGSEVEAQKQAGSNAEEVDLEGRVVLPGIIDAHTHLMLLGGALTKVDCLGKSIPQVQAAIKARREANPDAKMVLGCQFQYDALVELPHKKYLDEVVPDIPVFIDNSSLHSCWLNSAALEAVGITKDSVPPQGGEYVKDENGELTGYVKESAVIQTIWPYLVKHTSDEERVTMLESVFDAYLATGVTGAVDLATVEEDLTALEKCAKKHGGRLPIRVACHWLMRPGGTKEDRLKQVRTAAAHRERLKGLAPWLSVAGIKIVSDGVIDSCTAYLAEPYPNGATPGPIWPSDELEEVVTLADELGMQVACHAIGDAAVAQALDVFEAASTTNGPREGRRHRIEHLELVSEESIQRLAKMGVIASMQPVHADPVKVVNWCDVLQHDHRCDRMFPWKEFEDENANVAFGSDAPTAPYHPLPNVYTATTHKSAIDPDRPDPTTEREKNLDRLCVSLETSIKYYTAGSAYAMRVDEHAGTLEAGKSADFCVLDIDPWAQGLDSLRKAQKGVRETWVAGKKVWTKA